MAITGKNVVLKDLNGEYIIPYNGCVKTINGNSPDENGNIAPNMTGCLPLSGGTVTGNTTVKANFAIENVNNPTEILFNSSVVKGEVPTANKFFLWLALPSNGTDINYRLGAIQFAQRTSGNTDAKLVTYQNVIGGKSAEISVTYPASGTPYASAPTPDSSVTGNEIITASWGNNKYLKRDGSNDITAENLYWTLPYTLEDGTTGTLRTAPIHAKASASHGGLFAIRGMGGMTVVGSGESANAFITNMSTDYPTWKYDTERLVLTGDNSIDLIVDANTWSDRVRHNLNTSGLDTICTTLVKGENPSANIHTHQFLCDASGNASKNRFAGWEAWCNTAGKTAVVLRAYKNEAESTINAYLELGYNADGTTYTSAPTPSASSNDTNIATTAWVNRKVGSYLPLSGGTMTGLIKSSSDSTLRRRGSDGILQLGMENVIYGGRLNLYGKDYSGASAGGFELLTGDGTSTIRLVGLPDGSLS